MEDKVILVTNDDGITSKGIAALIEVAKEFGRVVVVAPDQPQSAMGHAITISKPLRMHRVEIFSGVESYSTSGTPVDCVKLAVDKVLHRKPDLCLSGINHGSNVAINVIYSGTMSAAMEAAIEGIQAIGVSSLNYDPDGDMEAAKHYARLVIKKCFDYGFPNSKLLNVNVPELPLEDIKGYKICRQANAKWVEEFDERKDPVGRKYFWLTGKFVNMDLGQDTDVAALENGYVSVVPVQYDLTAYKDLELLNNNWK